VLGAVTDRIRALAEIDIREERFSSFTGGTGTSKIIELTKVADTGCLDDSSAPPATSFDVSAGFLAEDRCLSVGAALSVAEFPAARFLAFVDTASFRSFSVNVSKESIPLKKRVVDVRIAPSFTMIPARCFRNLGLGGAEHRTGSTIPFSVGACNEFHLRIDFTSHVLLTCRALVVLVGLAELTAGVSGGVAGSGIPIVLVTGIILDGLMHGLCKKSGEVDQSVVGLSVRKSSQQFVFANPGVGHLLNCSDEIR
jgi:hypothetical protein